MRDLDYLNDIKIAGVAATEFLGGASLDAFLDDPKTQAACMRQLEIIGEAVKRLSDQTKNAYPNVPWREWAGMRDFLIYSYDSIDPERIKIP